MGQKWSQDQRTKFITTMRRKRVERRKRLAPKPIDAIPVDPQPHAIVDLDHVRHIVDGVWSGMSLDDKIKALDGVFFDPSNPNQD